MSMCNKYGTMTNGADAQVARKHVRTAKTRGCGAITATVTTSMKPVYRLGQHRAPISLGRGYRSYVN